MKAHSKLNSHILVLFRDAELLLVSQLLGSTYSGGDSWRVPPEVYEGQFGIPYDRAHQLSTDMRARYEHHRFNEPVQLTVAEIRAIDKAIQYMLTKWDDAEFSSIIGAARSSAYLLLDELRALVP